MLDLSQWRKNAFFSPLTFFYYIHSIKGGAFKISTINKISKNNSKNNSYLVGTIGLFILDGAKTKFGAMSILTTSTCNVERQLARIVYLAGDSKEVTLARKQREVAINANLVRLVELKR